MTEEAYTETLTTDGRGSASIPPCHEAGQGGTPQLQSAAVEHSDLVGYGPSRPPPIRRTARGCPRNVDSEEGRVTIRNVYSETAAPMRAYGPGRSAGFRLKCA